MSSHIFRSDMREGWARTDHEIMRFVTEHRTPGFDRFALDVMHAGGDPRVLGAAALIAMFLVAATGAWRPALAGVVALATASLVATALKNAIGRPRPGGALTLFDPGGYSMPSGHAARAAGLSVAVVVALHLGTRLLRRLVVGVVVLLNVVLGVLLVYLGTHWPTDVLAGWALGALIGWVCARLVLTLWPPPSVRAPEPASRGDDAARGGGRVREQDDAYPARTPGDDRPSTGG